MSLFSGLSRLKAEFEDPTWSWGLLLWCSEDGDRCLSSLRRRSWSGEGDRLLPLTSRLCLSLRSDLLVFSFPFELDIFRESMSPFLVLLSSWSLSMRSVSKESLEPSLETSMGDSSLESRDPFKEYLDELDILWCRRHFALRFENHT